MSALAPLLESYFVERLAQRGASPCTVASYRDTFCLLFGFAKTATGKDPSALDLADLDSSLIGAFLNHLETERGNALRTRNLRLTAIHSFFSYASYRCPEHAEVIQRVLLIPSKRANVKIVSFLTRPESDAVLAAPDRTTWLGRRDHIVLAVAIQTGLRVSELTGLKCRDVTLGAGANVFCEGKGRRQRRTPLTSSVARALRDWLEEHQGELEAPLFPNRSGGRLDNDSVTYLLAKHVKTATPSCLSLSDKPISPHTLRHTCAMNLLQAGVDIATIALWLGHASTRATVVYLHADLSMKERALARTAPQEIDRQRYQPKDSLLAFLEAL